MSSRVLREGDAVKVTPIAWRNANGSTANRPDHPPPGADAAADARAQLAELERQTDARVKAAYQQGQAASEAAATQRAAQRIEPALASLSHLTQELAGVRKRFRAEAEEDTVKLAIAIARRVLHRELATDREAILGLVIAAFQKLNARETHRLRLSPADMGTLQQYRERLDLPAGLEIVADASLPTGSAIFETSRGDLDASVDTQLAEIERGFADMIRRRSN
jgi:flagellar assembly protein FliH